MPTVLAAALLGGALAASGVLAIGGSFVAALGGSAFLAGAAVYGGLALVGQLLAPKPPSANLNSLTGTLRRTQRAAVMIKRWILGRARVAGYLVFYEETNDGRTVHMVLLLGVAPCSTIERIWIDGTEITIQRSQSGTITCSEYPDGQLEIRPYLSGDGAGGSALRNATDDWTAAHQLNDIAWAHIKLTQPTYGNDVDKRVWNRLPNIEFLVKGLEFTWPGQAVATWTENAAACRYWFLHKYLKIPSGAFDETDITDAYDICNQTVQVTLPTAYQDYPDTAKRYAVNGVISAGDNIDQINAEMDYAWAGNIVEADGLILFRPGATRPVAAELTDSDLLEDGAPVKFSPAPSIQQRVNAVTNALNQSSQHDWTELELPEHVDDDALARDKSKLAQSLGTRSFVVDPVTDGRLKALYLRRARASGIHEWHIGTGEDFANLELLPADIVTLTNSELGLDATRCVILSSRLNVDWTASLIMKELPENTYTDELVLPPLMPRKLTLPAPTEPPPAPTNLTAEIIVEIIQDGVIRTRMHVSWTEVAHGAIVTVTGPNDFEIKAIGASSAEIDLPGPGDYTASCRHVSPAGVVSDETTITAAASWDALIPPAPNALQVRQVSGFIQIITEAIPDRDIAGFEMRYNSSEVDSLDDLTEITAANWSTARRLDITSLVPSVSGRSLIATALVPITARYRISVRYVTRAGIEGPVADIGISYSQCRPLAPALFRAIRSGQAV